MGPRGECQQDFGVTCAALRLLDSGAIAQRLAQFRELSLQPPAEWVEPEQGAVQAREGMNQEILLAHMRPLVRKDNAQSRRVPGGVIAG